MKPLYLVLSGLTVLLLSSFSTSQACHYAGSNMNYVKARTEEAITTNDINQARFYAYKAIKVIQTSTNRFDNCGCKDAKLNIEESLINLKAATKSTSLNGTRILLQEALQQITDAIDAFKEHKMHETAFSSNKFVLNTEIENTQPKAKRNDDELYRQIDISLKRYTASINKVVDSVSCIEARAFADNIFISCEQQLLNTNLSEGKKYYNLRTKEITEKALLRIGDCSVGK